MRNHSFKDEQEAWEFLEREEQTNGHSASTPLFLYRGQTTRHFRRWPPIDEPGYRKHQLEFDSIIPTDYRGVEQIIEKLGKSAVPEKSGACAAIFRSIMTYACISEHGETLSGAEHDEVVKWLYNCIAGKYGEKFDAPGSVGQHYGFQTSYVDATSSLQVAIWFATREFSTGNYLAADDSVVYRIRIDALRKRCDDLNTAKGYSGRDRLRLVDISSTPRGLGQRAKNQAGWSLIGFECPELLRELIRTDAIMAVTFPRVAGPCTANNLKKDYITPPGENLWKIFEDVRSGNLFSPIRQQYVDEYINNDPSRSSLTSCRINLIDHRWHDWIF